MNAPSALTISKGIQSTKAYRLTTLLKTLTVSIAGATKAKNFRSNVTPAYRLGETVNHGGFGVGRVMAHWPDGRILIRFDGKARNQLVFPSLLSSK